ncbi:hypothetical protein ATE92_1931 [Ulvibacter sp. MAR_2010_11]|uniref:DUF5606 family protein n=1 Tax=Ulvibacter sp. MAR_2010_11 TaxID=1250229 RepID=UPI000C2BDF2E|nr:hypothetical protein ATE92_1931 [Ulvibacter sp. MAR_2010_11]
MSLEKILSIAGKPGLYQLKTQTRGGFLAESLVDGKKISVSTRHNVSLLSEIAIYTLTEEVPLREVFSKIAEKEEGGEAISHKSAADQLEEYFLKILPDYDEDRVYPSDIKKVVQWYNLLHKSGITDFSEAEETEESKEETAKIKELKKNPTSKAALPKGDMSKASSSKKGGSSKNTSARKT